ncbi:hypothetical protein WME90_36990 [Sorangium sp. So ce375]|uniref:hypothetical protein n=1 Tax=Sorangium sp. So ce375 TaxID=3133306 RepID=UPI003F5CA899
MTRGAGKPRGAARGREHAPSATHARQTGPWSCRPPLGSITTTCLGAILHGHESGRSYIGFGAQDTVGGSARAPAGLLPGAGWPVRVAEHPFGHGAKEVYLDEAFAFWREHEWR